MTLKRILVWAVLALFIAVNAVYWQDPWLWRRYVMLFDPTPEEGLTPFEEVDGGSTFIIPTASPDTRTISEDALEAAVAYAREFNSYAVIVVHDGRVQLEWYADGRSANQLTESQSMHKTLMGLFIGTAIEDGDIESVNDPVRKYIEEWQDNPRGDVTLKNLLQMSSGYGQYRFGLNPFSGNLNWLYSGDSVTPLFNLPLADWDQGTRYEYNNLNSELLGVVIERATGKRYAAYLEENYGGPWAVTGPKCGSTVKVAARTPLVVWPRRRWTGRASV